MPALSNFSRYILAVSRKFPVKSFDGVLLQRSLNCCLASSSSLASLSSAFRAYSVPACNLQHYRELVSKAHSLPHPKEIDQPSTRTTMFRIVTAILLLPHFFLLLRILRVLLVVGQLAALALLWLQVNSTIAVSYVRDISNQVNNLVRLSNPSPMTCICCLCNFGYLNTDQFFLLARI